LNVYADRLAPDAKERAVFLKIGRGQVFAFPVSAFTRMSRSFVARGCAWIATA
jgi:hypothetical protein